MALVRCILGKFLGVVCHCFPPCLDIPTFAARSATMQEILAAKSGAMGEKGCLVILPTWHLLFTPLGIFYMLQIYNMGPMALLRP